MLSDKQFFIGTDGNDTDENEYMEKQESLDGNELLYIHQGWCATVLLTKKEAMQLKKFIEEEFKESEP